MIPSALPTIPGVGIIFTVMDGGYSQFSRKAITVLSGAGISTDSGIPDYRGESGKTRTNSPITIKKFLESAEYRRHYWARSAAGWPWFSSRIPNDAHHILAELESREYLQGIITQNVDNLHSLAGSRNLIELHGNLKRVLCLECRQVEDRDHVQARMEEQNPRWIEKLRIMAPDGDAHISMDETRDFVSPRCRHCGGELKPDVVFFGESVERGRVNDAFAMVDRADMLLVLGSSLTVRSGLRFAEYASKQGVELVIVNRGETRADQLADVKAEQDISEWLRGLYRSLEDRDFSGAPAIPQQPGVV